MEWDLCFFINNNKIFLPVNIPEKKKIFFLQWNSQIFFLLLKIKIYGFNLN
jgi:hypothetical protein